MRFGRMNRLKNSLAFRLTLWYAAIFLLMAITVFMIVYALVDSAFKQRIDQDLLSQSREFEAVYAIEGIKMLQRAALLQSQTTGEKKMFFRLLYSSGVVFASSNMSFWRQVGIDRQAVEAVLAGQEPYYTTATVAGQDRQLRLIYMRIGSGIILQLGYSPENEERMLKTFQRIFLITLTALLLLAVVIGWFMARRALSGVASLIHTARQISKDDLHSRVPVTGRHDEIDRLAVTFNTMLDRIQSLVVATRQMNDNIAQDLRSPITRIRGLAEVTLLNAQQIEEFSHLAASTIEECDRLLDMINTMLTISRTEAGLFSIEQQKIDFTTVVQGACELFRALAEDRQIKMDCRLDEGFFVLGDRHLLQRLVANLLDNAIKYTDPQGAITVQLTASEEKRACLLVSDTGIGITDEDQGRIFERFFRGDVSRPQGGAGLGLSLARAVAVAHGGDISVKSYPGQGSTFAVLLPLS
jgi:heavy metal sensor kinase